MSGLDGALQNLAAALGGRDPTVSGSPYVLGDDGLGCLRDLKRWLQLYDEKKDVWEVKSALAGLNLVANDLCPILASWSLSETNDEHKFRVSLACVELLVPLTWPIQLDADADEFKARQYPNLKLAHSAYKSALLFDPEHDILSSIMRVSYPSLGKLKSDRTDRDQGIIKLVIYLLRNLGMIDEGRNRGETLLAFQKANALQFLCVLASGMGSEFIAEDIIVLDTIYHLVRGVDTMTLFDPSKASADTIKNDLSNLLSREKQLRNTKNSAAHTRHNRFGTMVSVVTEERRFTVVSQTAVISSKRGGNFAGIEASKKFNKPAKRIRTHEDVDLVVHLNVEARMALSTFTGTLLEAGFNPLMSSVLRAIENDSVRLLPESRLHYLFVQAWCFRALRAKARTIFKKADLTADFADDADYRFIAAMMDNRATIMLRKLMREAIDLKNWKTAHVAMECLQELLLTIDCMANSSQPEHQEIAENMQSNLFYEESTLDLIVTCVRSYNNQSFGYLNALTSLTSVMLKMLEKYASKKSHMFVKARRQRQRKQLNAPSDPDGSDGDLDDGTKESIREKAFNFLTFERKFVSDNAVTTYLTLLEYYADLNADQIRRVVHFLHRVFVKHKAEILLFRLDALYLFHRMLHDQVDLKVKGTARQELETFVQYVVKHFEKALEDFPALASEVLFEKLSSDTYYLTHDRNRPDAPRKLPRPPAEFTLKSGIDHDQGVKIAVGVLLDDNRSEFLNWLKETLAEMISRRSAWLDMDHARSEQTGEQERRPPDQSLIVDDEALRLLIFKDGKVRLLLKLLGLQREGDRDDVEAIWVMPATLDVKSLQNDLASIKRYTISLPTFEDDKAAKDFIRREAPRTIDRDDTSASESSDEEFRPRKSAKKSSRRQRQSLSVLSDNEVQARRNKRDELEAQRKNQIKSSKYVLSDDDEDGDEHAKAIFFAAEAALRERQKLRAAGLTIDKEHARQVDDPADKESSSDEESEDSNKENNRYQHQTTNKRTSTGRLKAAALFVPSDSEEESADPFVTTQRRRLALLDSDSEN